MKLGTVRMLSVVALVILEGCGGNDNPMSPGGVVPNTNFVASEPFTFNLDGAGRLRVRLEASTGVLSSTAVRRERCGHHRRPRGSV
jgi:hypothetical protein